MVNETILESDILGIKAVNQLPIDAKVWNDAHSLHVRHRNLHGAFLHRPGIVYGLEVVIASKDAKKLIVMPGVAIDGDGQTIVLKEATTIHLKQAGDRYIIVAFIEAPDKMQVLKVGDGTHEFRVREEAEVSDVNTLPRKAYVELARVSRVGANNAVKDPADPFDPGIDELNLLHREYAFPHCYADGVIGELCLLPTDNPDDWRANRPGLFNLVREANGRGFHVTFSGLHNLGADDQPEPLVLYVAGKGTFSEPSADQVKAIARILGNGGTLMGEAIDGDKAFAEQFEELAKKKFGAKLQKIGPGHPLFVAHHVFPSIPAGAMESGQIGTDDEAGVILSTMNYGGAWQGKFSGKTAGTRETVRTAQEFGLNMIAWAYQRRRQHEIRMKVG
jgi:hypothetical protein